MRKCFNFFLVISTFSVHMVAQDVVSNYYGIFSDNPNILARLPIDDARGHVYIWEGTLSGLITDPYEGEGCLAFRSTGKGWWGFGIHDDSAVSLTHFNSGYLIFSVKTSAKDEFSIHVYGANKTEAKITFVQNGGPQNFKRDGTWHKIVIPVSDLVAQGLDLSSVSIPFAAIGGSISNIAFDDIFFSIDNKGPTNPVVHPQPDPEPEKPSAASMLNMKFRLTMSSGLLNIGSPLVVKRLIISDVTGKIFYQASPNQKSYTVNLMNWPKGLYLVKAFTEDNRQFTDKLIIR
ncbi:MAG: T9SS type A sorting domain-containing protein [Bacteroidales bacterium]|nr:T9SS type A sorting domain-containing protein [Bacteroidales bacterium]